jgi:hypothetical protein
MGPRACGQQRSITVPRGQSEPQLNGLIGRMNSTDRIWPESGRGYDRPCRARPIGPWSRRTGAPEASATGRNRMTLPRPVRGLPTIWWLLRVGLTQRPGWSRRRHEIPGSSSAAVPPACHKQRSRAVSSGHSRSLRGGRWTGRPSLTWGGGGGRNCMACKGSHRDCIARHRGVVRPLALFELLFA